jgi:hypothetical protein
MRLRRLECGDWSPLSATSLPPHKAACRHLFSAHLEVRAGSRFVEFQAASCLVVPAE